MDLTFKLTGAEQIINRLSKFPDKLQDAAGKRSARKAMAIVRKAAQIASRALDDPESPEKVFKNVYLQQSRRQSKRVGGVVMRVGILGGASLRNAAAAKSNPGGATWYWRFIELGTENEPARPFMRSALENNVGQVTDTLITELNKEIDRISAET